MQILLQSEDADDDEDEDEEEDGNGDSDEEKDDAEDYSSEDDQDYEGSPSRDSEDDMEAPASPGRAELQSDQRPQEPAGSAFQQESVEGADPMDELGSFSPIQGSCGSLAAMCAGAIAEREDKASTFMISRRTRGTFWLGNSYAQAASSIGGVDISREGVPTAVCLCADMSLPQNLDDEEAIYQRTRTRMPLNHVSLDELDALLGKEDEGLFDEEGEQYEQFLRVTQSTTTRGIFRDCSQKY